MAEIQLGKGHIFSLGSAALACTAIATYTSPNLQNAEVSHDAKVAEIRGQTGAVTGLIYVDDDELTVNFTIIPEGATKAAALVAGSIPQRGTPFGTATFPVISIGKFMDALNVAEGGSSPFIYDGGAQLTGPFDGAWGLRLPLKRRKNVTSGTPIS